MNSFARELLDRLCAEQRSKWLCGERVSVEELVDRHPALRSDPEALVDLIYQEYLIREELGESVYAEEFYARYPQFRQQLTRQFRLHAALESDLSTRFLDDAAGGGGREIPPRMAESELKAILGECPETQRFDILRPLASGGMGTVYAAYDRHWRQKVALKCLHRLDAAELYRLKQEFRVIGDLDHRNFIQLFELFSLDPLTFFTMELVEGVDFVRACRSGLDPGCSSVDVEALRDALRQLAEALSVLHESGRVHCDIKPSNVLVSGSGRLVLLDFGLALNRQQWQAETPRWYLRGTAAFLPPETLTGKAPSPAGDWYAVGVMLYQCLTGRLPFDGTLREVIQAKQQTAPPTIGRAGGEVPRDLEQLCMQLLSREPSERPSAAEVLARLGGGRREEASLVFEWSRHECFVGRRAELRALEAAFQRLEEGETVRLLVGGPSGVGKTALVNHFLDKLEQRGDALLLPSRCHEQESVPVNAFDHLMDRLSIQLRKMPRDEIQAILPADMGPLLRMFPVLQRSGMPTEVEPDPCMAHDPQELRRTAVQAFRTLLTRLSRRKRLVLLIDDLHWGDPDSAALLADLLGSADAPPLLLLGCSRPTPGRTDSLLSRLEQLAPDGRFWDVTLKLEALSLDQATELARRHLEDSSLRTAELAARISGGNPFLVVELTRFGMPSLAASEQVHGRQEELADRLLRARADDLPESLRRLLEVVAVAGEPLDPETAFHAAHVTGHPQKAWRTLRLGRLVRLEPARHGSEQIEAYHDRVREAIVRQLPAEVIRRHHRNLALALEATDQPDPERLARHHHAAGSVGRAWEYAVQAADQAAETLAFDQAARLYRLALGTGAGAAGERTDVQRRLADALAHAGRGAEAGPVYLQAAEKADAAERQYLRQRAAEQFLRAGRFDQGIGIFQDLLQAVGLKWPRTTRRALLVMITCRARLRLRGFHFRPRAVEDIPAIELARIDLCWTAATVLGMVDIVRGLSFMPRHTLLALRAGEPARIARTLSFEAAAASWGISKNDRLTTRLLEQAEEVARLSGQPQAAADVAFLAAYAAFCQGDFLATVERALAAERLYRQRCTNTAWEVDTIQVFLMHVYFYLGRMNELSRRVSHALQEARDRGDQYLAGETRGGCNNATWLAADDVPRARRELAEAKRLWPRRDFVSERLKAAHFTAVIAQVQIELYMQDGQAAWDCIDGAWPALVASGELKMGVLQLEMLNLRGRAALAAARQNPGKAQGLLRSAARDARKLERNGIPWARSLACLIRSGIATLQDQPAVAEDLIRTAVEGFDAAHLALYAAVARRRLGQLIGGEQGRALISAAEQFLHEQGIRNPHRMTAMLAPISPGETL